MRRDRFVTHKQLAMAVGMDPSSMHKLLQRHGIDIPMSPGPGTNGQRTRLYSEAEAAVVFKLRQEAGFHTPTTLEALVQASRAKWPHPKPVVAVREEIDYQKEEAELKQALDRLSNLDVAKLTHEERQRRERKMWVLGVQLKALHDRAAKEAKMKKLRASPDPRPHMPDMRS